MSLSDDRCALWRGLLSEQKSSGLSAAAFCRDRALSIKCFGYWRKRLSVKPAPAPQWVALVPARASVCPPPSVERSEPLTLRIGIVSVDVCSGFDRRLLREIVGALETR
jgi:hypothetical protein